MCLKVSFFFFLEVFMIPNHLVPPIANKWREFHHPCANGWELAYEDHIRHFKELISPNVATCETVSLDWGDCILYSFFSNLCLATWLAEHMYYPDVWTTNLIRNSIGLYSKLLLYKHHHKFYCQCQPIQPIKSIKGWQMPTHATQQIHKIIVIILKSWNTWNYRINHRLSLRDLCE